MDRFPRLLVLGANGPTGRDVVRQALDRGHEVRALTRRPDTFPLRHERLQILAGDATDRVVIDDAVAQTDAVICTIGAKFTRHAVDVYSTSAHLLITAMAKHDRQRMIVVTSSGVAPSEHRHGPVQKVPPADAPRLRPDRVRRHGADGVVRTASDLDWTIVRPPGLPNSPGQGYATQETEIDGDLCSRPDLAEMLLDQLTDDRYVRKIAAVTTPGLSVSARGSQGRSPQTVTAPSPTPRHPHEGDTVVLDQDIAATAQAEASPSDGLQQQPCEGRQRTVALRRPPRRRHQRGHRVLPGRHRP